MDLHETSFDYVLIINLNICLPIWSLENFTVGPGLQEQNT